MTIAGDLAALLQSRGLPPDEARRAAADVFAFLTCADVQRFLSSYEDELPGYNVCVTALKAKVLR